MVIDFDADAIPENEVAIGNDARIATRTMSNGRMLKMWVESRENFAKP